MRHQDLVRRHVERARVAVELLRTVHRGREVPELDARDHDLARAAVVAPRIRHVPGQAAAVVAAVPDAVVPAVVLADDEEVLADDAHVARPALHLDLAVDLHVRWVARVDGADDGAVERGAVGRVAVPVADDHRRDAVLDEHLDRRAVHGRAPQKLRVVGVRDVEHHEPAVAVEEVEPVAVDAIDVRLLRLRGVHRGLCAGIRGRCRVAGRLAATAIERGAALTDRGRRLELGLPFFAALRRAAVRSVVAAPGERRGDGCQQGKAAEGEESGVREHGAPMSSERAG